MVHVVKKKIGNKNYLYLQKSFYNKATKLSYTKHVAYLGPEEKVTPEMIELKKKEVG